VPQAEAAKNARLKILRKRVEQNFQKYFWDLCAVGDANNDGNIDLDEWLDVMNDIVKYLKDNGKFPEWYEGLHKSLFRANEFLGECAWLNLRRTTSLLNLLPFQMTATYQPASLQTCC
jgi:hypothetical protein